MDLHDRNGDTIADRIRKQQARDKKAAEDRARMSGIVGIVSHEAYGPHREVYRDGLVLGGRDRYTGKPFLSEVNHNSNSVSYGSGTLKEALIFLLITASSIAAVGLVAFGILASNVNNSSGPSSSRRGGGAQTNNSERLPEIYDKARDHSDEQNISNGIVNLLDWSVRNVTSVFTGKEGPTLESYHTDAPGTYTYRGEVRDVAVVFCAVAQRSELRAGPGMEYNFMKTLPAGTEITGTGISIGSWRMLDVKVNGEDKYAYGHWRQFQDGRCPQ